MFGSDVPGAADDCAGLRNEQISDRSSQQQQDSGEYHETGQPATPGHSMKQRQLQNKRDEDEWDRERAGIAIDPQREENSRQDVIGSRLLTQCAGGKPDE